MHAHAASRTAEDGPASGARLRGIQKKRRPETHIQCIVEAVSLLQSLHILCICMAETAQSSTLSAVLVGHQSPELREVPPLPRCVCLLFPRGVSSPTPSPPLALQKVSSIPQYTIVPFSLLLGQREAQNTSCMDTTSSRTSTRTSSSGAQKVDPTHSVKLPRRTGRRRAGDTRHGHDETVEGGYRDGRSMGSLELSDRSKKRKKERPMRWLARRGITTDPGHWVLSDAAAGRNQDEPPRLSGRIDSVWVGVGEAWKVEKRKRNSPSGNVDVRLSLFPSSLPRDYALVET
ncbi:hypothetical protein GQ53DRAFT_168433 [Thozetella sp. PMI_491]|nr:hypothetical protein GQ53DRAFT_168433 [Thozetella sp. PMI_491]